MKELLKWFLISHGIIMLAVGWFDAQYDPDIWTHVHIINGWAEIILWAVIRKEAIK